jgi:hypothetical protein
MFTSKTQRGQAIILIVFAIVGLLAMTALAIDSGNAFGARRRAQSAADNAALSAALAKINTQSLTTAVLTITRLTGFDDSAVTIQNPPGAGCDGSTPNPVRPADPYDPYKTDSINYYIQVIIRSSVDTYFGPVIGINQINNCVQAITRAKPLRYIPPFFGNAVVGLSPEGDSYDSGTSNAVQWKIKGGGIFSNHNAYSKNHDSVIFPDGHCVLSVGTASNFNCPVAQNMTEYFYNYPEDVTVFLPPTPPCDGTAYVDTGGDGKIHEEPGFENRGSRIASFAGDYAPGVYCITDAGGNIHSTITGTGVTFYILDTDFTMKFNGGGSFSAQAPTQGPNKSVLIFAPITEEPCSQNIDIRGNGSTPIIGTVIMPSACIDYRGNGTGDAMDSMLVGYFVTSNGNADVTVTYNSDNNYKYPEPPTVELVK